ncbi:hypothetical protein A3Q56_03568 [Intoshia linei]|uniref:Uncharacterized protein n=1 Tax=Intoshia linei TaxID=1819745 RepID=A0A177B389_9BILA|nr:hypothetical protein A3Q56_03568 [Intoshia linei]
MLIKTLSRNPDEYVRETKNCTHKVFRNYDEKVHPFKVEREYTRALNATKLDRVFSKPFVACLDSHSDGVNRIAIHPNELSTVVSGSYDGEIKLWNLQTKNCVKTCSSYNGYVQGLTFSVDGERLYSVFFFLIYCIL